jgi:hypothetical protein
MKLKLKTLSFVSLLSGICLSACGNSPLLHHRSAVEPSALRPADSSPANVARCSLILNTSKLCAQLSWDQGPQSHGESAFTLSFSGLSAQGFSNGSLQDPTTNFNVYLWMPDMGHGSSPVEIRRSETGLYKVTRAYFIMPGTWEIRIQVGPANSPNDEAAYKVKVP